MRWGPYRSPVALCTILRAPQSGRVEGITLGLETMAVLIVIKLLGSMSGRPLGLRDPPVQWSVGALGSILLPFLVFVVSIGSPVHPETAQHDIASAHGGHSAAGSTLATAKSSTEPATHTVAALDNVFEPMRLTIAPEDTVEWVNEGKLPHTVSSDAGEFESGNLDSGQTFKYTFDE